MLFDWNTIAFPASVQDLQLSAPLTLSGEGLWVCLVSSGQCSASVPAAGPLPLGAALILPPQSVPAGHLILSRAPLALVPESICHLLCVQTLTLVAAGVVAKKMIGPIEIRARITELGGIPRERLNCEPGRELGAEGAPTLWDELIDRTLRELDSVGGVIECTCDKVPVGLGEPFFDSLESQLAHLAFSIPAVRGIEFGDGFAAARMKGSEHNDCFVNGEGKTATNGAGGINGGISNGNPVVFRVAVKPTSSIAKKQYTFNFATGRMEEFVVKGRHDACIALRCPVVVEAIAAIALANN